MSLYEETDVVNCDQGADHDTTTLSLQVTKSFAFHQRCAMVEVVQLVNRGFSKWNPGSLSAWQKYLNVEVILLCEFVISEIYKNHLYENVFEVILVSEFMKYEFQKYESLLQSCLFAS